MKVVSEFLCGYHKSHFWPLLIYWSITLKRNFVPDHITCQKSEREIKQSIFWGLPIVDGVKIERKTFFAFELSLGLIMEKIPLPQISLTFCKTAILSLFYLAISKTDEISLSPGTPPWLNYHRNCPSYNFLDDSILKGNSYLKSLSFKVVSFSAFCLHRVPLVMNDWQDWEGSPCHSLS